ncbi:MAG TPA: hypothetical protein VFR55_07065 [Dehalococcoidia bacterium]|nr:hypothetical protein [Dehalococcoidia bacterium]
MRLIDIERLLPGIFQRTVRPGNPLYGILQVMELLHAPSEEILDHLESFFDPYRTPDEFVFFLARWVDLERLIGKRSQGASPDANSFPSGVGRLRELILAAAYLSKWRGTSRGLIKFLETATGLTGFEINENPLGENSVERPFHVVIRVPSGADRYRELIETIVEMEKPAYVTSDLEFRDSA